MKQIPKSDLPTVEKLLSSAMELASKDHLLWSANGQFVATGLDISEDGCLRLLTKHHTQVNWRR